MTFGLLTFPGVEELDLVGPWELLSLWHQLAGGPQCLVISESGGAITCAKGLSLNPLASFATCPPLDYLLVPGGQGTRTEVGNARLLEFVAARGEACQAVLSVCTGAFLLHAAGRRAGRTATTHWGSLERLRALGDVTVVEERFVQDGTIWSSAGIAAGMDLMLAFIASVAGEDVAAQVQFASEYYPSARRYGDLHTSHPAAPAYLRQV